MRHRPAWTLVEAIVVVAILALLGAILLPSLAAAKDSARLAGCAAAMRDVHVGLMTYTAENRRRLPPFAFSDIVGNVALSGHWGGATQANDPAIFGRLVGLQAINLSVLAEEGKLSVRRLVCPGAETELLDGQASYFSHTFRFSTYCLRMPPSDALFDTAPALRNFSGKTLGIYAQAAGGQRVRVGTTYQEVPLTRTDRAYPLAAPAACGDGTFDFAQDVVVADSFWRQEHSAPATQTPGPLASPVRAGWCHGKRFNVLAGHGAVRTIADDGTVSDHTVPPGGTIADDGANGTTHAERVWQFFDATP